MPAVPEEAREPLLEPSAALEAQLNVGPGSCKAQHFGKT
ncbi:unannotated protein [freshwater metagenome]|uniref:Unannotated protein n=1 Tax=freshwater metagenome TaxID=449393 RepID=A0A6J6CKX3_9ZZZZ